MRHRVEGQLLGSPIQKIRRQRGEGVPYPPAVSWPARVALVLLALIVAAFVATWLSIPAPEPGHAWAYSRNISPPAHWFLGGLETRGEAGIKHVFLHDLRERIAVVYGGAAVVLVLVGLAVGAGRRTAQRPSEWAESRTTPLPASLELASPSSPSAMGGSRKRPARPRSGRDT
jgi:hypothetical protein